MLHSMVTWCFLGQYILCPLLSSLYPSHLPSSVLGSSLPPFSFRTNTFVPHSGRLLKLSFVLCIVSYGIFPSSACVEVQFFNQTACRIDSVHRNLGTPAARCIAHACSSSIWFNCSDTPFSSGVSCTVRLLTVPFVFSRWAVNSCERYSPPQSVC